MLGQDDNNDNQTVQPMSTTPPNEDVMGVGQVTTAPAVDTSTSDNTPTDDDDQDIDQIVDDINSNDDTSPASNISPELQAIKKSALQELSPLLDELNETPEEKLNILMMTIQASDDQSLIPKAFEVAKQIENKKARAEAMLDIIQEINYFTKK